MIDYVVKAPAPIAEEFANKEFYFTGYLDRDYCLKMLIYDENVEFPECRVRLINYNDNKMIITHRFFEKGFVRFKIDNITPMYEDFCMIKLYHDFPNLKIPPTYVEMEILEIRADLINPLKISEENKKQLFKMIDFYLNEDFKSALNIMSILSEFFARELAQKAKKKKFNDFGSAVEALVHIDKNRRTKINYIYLGSLLYPIYYIRNQKLHPYHQIEFDESTARMVLFNISELFKHIIEKDISL